MGKIKSQTIFIVFLITFFNASLFMSDCLAQVGMKAMEEIEKKEREVGVTITRPKVAYTAEKLKDPFEKPAIEDKSTTKETARTGEKPLPKLTVQGIVWGGNFPQAIINNTVVKVGDTIGGVRIISIEKGGISVFFEGQQYMLSSPAGQAMPAKAP